MPPLKNKSVGIDRMPYRAARSGWSSILTFTSVTPPPDSGTSWSMIGLRHPPLEIEPAETGQADVEHEAAGHLRSIAAQELLGGGERGHA